jgi:signal transduction histidine kinase
MTLSDITEVEKNRLLKQQISSNITHELRTPVSSIRGYMETILANPEMDAERRCSFVEKAHAQAVRLSDLIRDVSLINKVEEAPEALPKEEVGLRQMVEDVVEEFQMVVAEKKMTVENCIAAHLKIVGNYALLHSVFRNLIENSLRYAGEAARIKVECYNEDTDFCYFRYYDTGNGVGEEHLSRLFERFYRVGEGRTRDGGGTGLGLSIVRNAVLFHQGTISVRNRKGGGLEFLFTLKKNA